MHNGSYMYHLLKQGLLVSNRLQTEPKTGNEGFSSAYFLVIRGTVGMRSLGNTHYLNTWDQGE
jgi:hypothetical protein